MLTVRTILVGLGLALAVSAQPKAYPLAQWDMETCVSKGRMQDREYVHASVMRRIVADEKRAIPILISQLTDTRLVKNIVYCYNWGQLEVGELAYFILADLFWDQTSARETMPLLFPVRKQCPADSPSWECWSLFKKKLGMKTIQARWTKFWAANESKVYWDSRCQCYRVR